MKLMASPLKFKVFSPDNEYVAGFRYAEDAAALVGIYGPGAKIRSKLVGNRIIWREGKEGFCAADSYDGCAKIMWDRIKADVEARLAKAGVKINV